MLSIQIGLAESESVSIAGTKWSVSAAKNGTYKISCPLLVYDAIDGQLVVNEAQAEIVGSSFQESYHGKGTQKLPMT